MTAEGVVDEAVPRHSACRNALRRHHMRCECCTPHPINTQRMTEIGSALSPEGRRVVGRWLGHGHGLSVRHGRAETRPPSRIISKRRVRLGPRVKPGDDGRESSGRGPMDRHWHSFCGRPLYHASHGSPPPQGGGGAPTAGSAGGDGAALLLPRPAGEDVDCTVRATPSPSRSCSGRRRPGKRRTRISVSAG
jgi:hypothetical protein